MKRMNKGWKEWIGDEKNEERMKRMNRGWKEWIEDEKNE